MDVPDPYLRHDVDGGGVQRPLLRSGGGCGTRPHDARPTDGRDSPGRLGTRTTGLIVVHRRAVVCPSSVRGVLRWPPSVSGTANCDKDSHGGDDDGGGSTGSVATAPGGAHWTHC